jgi:hypothetical protein
MWMRADHDSLNSRSRSKHHRHPTCSRSHPRCFGRGGPLGLVRVGLYPFSYPAMTEVAAGFALMEDCCGGASPLPESLQIIDMHHLATHSLRPALAELMQSKEAGEIYLALMEDVSKIPASLVHVTPKQLGEIVQKHQPAFREKGICVFYCRVRDQKMRDDGKMHWFEFFDATDKYRPHEEFPRRRTCVIL